MTVLVLVVCLSYLPVCHEVMVPGVEWTTPIGCAVAGEQEALTWLDEHPKYRLKGWRCGPAERGA